MDACSLHFPSHQQPLCLLFFLICISAVSAPFIMTTKLCFLLPLKPGNTRHTEFSSASAVASTAPTTSLSSRKCQILGSSVNRWAPPSNDKFISEDLRVGGPRIRLIPTLTMPVPRTSPELARLSDSESSFTCPFADILQQIDVQLYRYRNLDTPVKVLPRGCSRSNRVGDSALALIRWQLVAGISKNKPSLIWEELLERAGWSSGWRSSSASVLLSYPRDWSHFSVMGYHLRQNYSIFQQLERMERFGMLPVWERQ